MGFYFFKWWKEKQYKDERFGLGMRRLRGYFFAHVDRREKGMDKRKITRGGLGGILGEVYLLKGCTGIGTGCHGEELGSPTLEGSRRCTDVVL